MKILCKITIFGFVLQMYPSLQNYAEFGHVSVHFNFELFSIHAFSSMSLSKIAACVWLNAYNV